MRRQKGGDQAMGENLLTYVVGAALAIVPLWRIFGRAGLAPALSLLTLIPVVGFTVAIAVLALKRWPVLGRAGEPAGPQA
jgi:hypothetical protein